MKTSQEDKVRLLCYSPLWQKRFQLQEAYKKKSPVKIVGTKRALSKFDSSQKEHIIKKSARIVPASLNFEFDEQLFHVNNLISLSVLNRIDIEVNTKDDTKQPLCTRNR